LRVASLENVSQVSVEIQQPSSSPPKDGFHYGGFISAPCRSSPFGEFLSHFIQRHSLILFQLLKTSLPPKIFYLRVAKNTVLEHYPVLLYIYRTMPPAHRTGVQHPALLPGLHHMSPITTHPE
jgi:hypothetical protein